jgi:hypothetical protein
MRITVCLACILVFLIGCGNDAPPASALSVTITPASATVAANRTIDLTGSASGFTATPTISWYMLWSGMGSLRGACGSLRATRDQPLVEQGPFPAGAPPMKRTLLTDGILELLAQPWPEDPSLTWAQAIARTLVSLAAKGDVRAAAEVMNRVEGKPPKQIELSFNRYPRGISDDEIDAGVDELLRRPEEAGGETATAVVPSAQGGLRDKGGR